MKTTKVLYWIFNGLFAFIMFGSGIPAVLSTADEIKGIHDMLGYPAYIIPVIGVAKIIGSVALFIPGYPRLKEWAYAGLTFDLILATFSVYKVPNPGGPWYVMLVFLAIAAGAYITYHKLVKVTSDEQI